MEEICLAKGVRARTQVRAIRRGRTAVAGNITPLTVVKDVVRLRPEFEPDSLRDGKVLEERHIEVGAVWIAKEVPGRVAECQTARRGERIGIKQERSSSLQGNLNNTGVRVANHIGTRPPVATIRKAIKKTQEL